MLLAESLDCLAAAIATLPERLDHRPIANPYVARSLLQKALRRADPVQAERAVISMIAAGTPPWRALAICAFEDFGASSLEALQITVTACTSKSIRLRMGSEQAVGRAVVHSLAHRPRDRRIDELYMASAFSLSGNCRRLQFYSDLVEHTAVVRADTERPVPGCSFKSVIAAHADAHLKKFHDEGQIGPIELAMCVQGRKTSQCLLPVIYPLAKEALARAGHSTRLKSNATPEVRIVGGIPGYAFDGFTREGRDALTHLLHQNSDLRSLLSVLDTKRAQLNALRALLFAVEGGVCTQEVSSSDYVALKSFALAGWSSLPSNTLPEALATVRKAIPMLNDIREKVVR